MKYYEKFRNNINYITIFILAVLLIDIIIINTYIFKIDLKINGKKEVVVIYPNDYIEEGATATLFGNDVSRNIEIVSRVNPKIVGVYKVKYIVSYGIIKNSVTRVVKVVDNLEPEITLNGDKTTYICKNQVYVDEGIKAIDNYDGDITDKVIIKNKKDEIIYTVNDSSNNKTKAIRKKIVGDNQNPTINLNGEKEINLYVGTEYKEPGVTAFDNCDGDISNKVETIGNVNHLKEGNYDITYKVKDSEGNESSVTRVVKVNRKVITGSSVNAGTPGVIYLTFDDGPGAGTSKILDILKRENVKATFFVTCSGSDELLYRAYNEGHTIALHTASHAYKQVYSSLSAYYEDLNKVSERVKRVTGVDSKIIRFPGGSSNTISRGIKKGIMTEIAASTLENGYHYFDWNVDSNDAGSCASKRTSSCVYNNVIKGLSKSRSNVVLMHDIKTYTASAIESIIKYGKENNYSFEAITMDTAMVRHSINN